MREAPPRGGLTGGGCDRGPGSGRIKLGTRDAPHAVLVLGRSPSGFLAHRRLRRTFQRAWGVQVHRRAGTDAVR